MIPILMIEKVMENQKIYYIMMMNLVNWNIHFASLNVAQRRKYPVMIQKTQI
jgi:fructose/tagatose bisphosphate aldolase